MTTASRNATDPKTAAAWCRDTRAAISAMTSADLASEAAGIAGFEETSPTYRAILRMMRNEDRRRQRAAGAVRG